MATYACVCKHIVYILFVVLLLYYFLSGKVFNDGGENVVDSMKYCLQYLD